MAYDCIMVGVHTKYVHIAQFTYTLYKYMQKQYSKQKIIANTCDIKKDTVCR